MTNNTIPNVPRELLADLLGNDHDKRIMAERHLLAMLANAPSPAGVDGLEVECAATYVSEFMRAVPSGLVPLPDRDQLCRLSDAQAIIDGLRGEADQWQQLCAEAQVQRDDYQSQRDQQAQRIGELERLLREVRNGLGCENLHHKKSEQHAFDEPCKVLVRIDAALSAGKEGE